MTGFSEYANYDALGLAKLVANKEVTANELLDEALLRVEQLNPQINAIIHQFHDKARAAIKAGLPNGPFKGVPFMLKDLLAAYAGEPMTSGSRFFKDYVPPHDSELVRRYKQAGLVIFAKTNTPEFGVTPITDPELLGSARNPWNTDHTPGGSSGGSAAAVAARIIPAANGGDGGGSIRLPASCCGLVGLKPTRGRIPTGPVFGDLWFGLTSEHVLTRTVRDSAAFLDATAGEDPGPANVAPPPVRDFLQETGEAPGKLRIAFTTDPLLARQAHPENIKGIENTVKLLQDLGHEVTEATPKVDREDFIFHFGILVAADTAAIITAGEQQVGRKPRKSDFEAGTWALRRLGQAFSAEDVSRAVLRMHEMGRRIGHFMQDYDVWLTPSMGCPPLPVGGLKPKGMDALSLKLVNNLPISKLATRRELMLQTATPTFDWMSTTPLSNASGQPSMSLPLHETADGLPLGMLFTGRFGDEATLFRLAAQLEQARPWVDKKPAICG